MIIVKLTGGLGNQMFQYAAGRRLAEKHSTLLKLDVTGFEEYKLRRYSLHCFQCWEYIATKNEIDNIIYQQGFVNDLKHKMFSIFKLQLSKNSNWIIEKQFNFDNQILNSPNNILLDGYWQTEKYFSDITGILQREFFVKYQQDTQSQKVANQIKSTESISLHVRRTDYVQNTLTNQIHGTCDQDYYDRAVSYIGERVINPHFFIFSDEPEWARSNLKLRFPMTVVDCNDASRNYEDLRLMSMCKHNVIANSSFSWWAAWLNPNSNKIVLAPQKWFNDNTRNTKDLIPDQWIKL